LELPKIKPLIKNSTPKYSKIDPPTRRNRLILRKIKMKIAKIAAEIIGFARIRGLILEIFFEM